MRAFSFLRLFGELSIGLKVWRKSVSNVKVRNSSILFATKQPSKNPFALTGRLLSQLSFLRHCCGIHALKWKIGAVFNLVPTYTWVARHGQDVTLRDSVEATSCHS
jgi:hypothetical protein